ncbi:hypothetical protein M413DRAFT_56254, partial [Hebeloma cylindrosporum]
MAMHKKFVKAQPLFAVDFAGNEIEIDNQLCIEVDDVEFSYSLLGIVYYGNDHFTARIILNDGSIWFHDGITTGQTTVYDGSL